MPRRPGRRGGGRAPGTPSDQGDPRLQGAPSRTARGALRADPGSGRRRRGRLCRGRGDRPDQHPAGDEARHARGARTPCQPPDHLLIDALRLREVDLPQRPIIDGDAISASIAAASIVAKVTRDRICDEIDHRYPAYGFARHKGYGTRRHVDALVSEGPCEWHRRSFAPIRMLLAGVQLPLDLDFELVDEEALGLD